jgi:hypothetical protein
VYDIGGLFFSGSSSPAVQLKLPRAEANLIIRNNKVDAGLSICGDTFCVLWALRVWCLLAWDGLCISLHEIVQPARQSDVGRAAHIAGLLFVGCFPSDRWICLSALFFDLRTLTLSLESYPSRVRILSPEVTAQK